MGWTPLRIPLTDMLDADLDMLEELDCTEDARDLDVLELAQHH